MHKKKKKKKQKKNIGLRILTAAAAFGAGAGLIFVLLYALGGTRLRAAAESSAPDAVLLTDAGAAEDIQKRAGLSTVQWQDDWVALDGKVYSYDDSRINLLVLGIDKGGKISGETDYEEWGSGQTDAIFVVSIDPAKEGISIVGIPRNSMVDIDIYDREGHVSERVFDQICLQYPFAGGGKPGLKKVEETVSGLLYGLPIHGGFAIGYDAVSGINDMVGGVDVTALESLETPYGSYEKGEKLHLEGDFVLAYVKTRNMDILGSPTMRLERQKQYLTALISRVKGEVKKNPAIVSRMYGTVSDYMNTDVTLDKAVYLATQAAGYSFGGDSIRLLQGEDRAVAVEKNGIETGDYYDDYYLDEESLKKTMIEVFYTEVTLEE